MSTARILRAPRELARVTEGGDNHMNPRGAPPAALAHLDDVLLDAACCVDAQLMNSTAMLEACDRIFADGLVTGDDFDDVLYLRRHVRLEDQLNRDQESLMRWGRWAFERVSLIVREYRGKLQDLRKAEAAR
ncbi:MAG: hypothetical protein ACYC6T_08185 [Thermoleophilia bacterium]